MFVPLTVQPSRFSDRLQSEHSTLTKTVLFLGTLERFGFFINVQLQA